MLQLRLTIVAPHVCIIFELSQILGNLTFASSALADNVWAASFGLDMLELWYMVYDDLNLISNFRYDVRKALRKLVNILLTNK